MFVQNKGMGIQQSHFDLGLTLGLRSRHMPRSGWNVVCSENKGKVGVLRLEMSCTLLQKKVQWHLQCVQEQAGAECPVEAAPGKARLTGTAVVPSADPLLRFTELRPDESISYSEFSQSQWTLLSQGERGTV